MNLNEIKKILLLINGAYPTSPPPTDPQAKIWLKFFEPLEPKVLFEAIQKHIASNKYPPTIADINSILNSNNSELGYTKIMKAISKFGSWDEEGAKEYLGEYWPAVERYGWKTLCALEISQMPIISAQLKQTVEAVIKNKTDNKSFQQINFNKNKELSHEK